MTKSDLKTGMVIETKDGRRYLIMRMPNGNILASNDDCWMYLNNHKEDLTYEIDSLSIMKVFTPCPGTLVHMVTDKCKPIWERKAKKMTMEEICKALGYDVEIVK